MQWLSKCSDHQKCTKGILKHRGHFWGPGTLFLKSAMTRPIGDITQWWPSGSLPHKSPSREALLRLQERLHIDTIPINSQVGEAQWHPSRSCPGGMEEWRSGTAMASYMRSDSGILHGSTSPKRQCCRSQVTPSKEHDSFPRRKCQPLQDASFLCLAGPV